jgi:hypothetical protein
MQLLHRKGPLLKQVQSHLRKANLIHGAAVRIVGLTAMISLIGAVSLARSADAFILPSGEGGTELNVSQMPPGLKAQILMGRQQIKINVDNFNKQREREIANDTQRLLSLAIALRVELSRSSGGKLSADAIAKVKKIEKLAKDVKQKMQINPSLGPI